MLYQQQMANTSVNANTSRHRPLSLVLSGLILICLLLLSACSGSNSTAGNSPTALPTAAISYTLHQQGSLQLQTFQQWIALMQQYNGDISSYQQEFTSDQQALQAAQT